MLKLTLLLLAFSCTSPLGSSSGGAGGTSGLSEISIKTQSDVCDPFIKVKGSESDVCAMSLSIVPNSSTSGISSVNLKPKAIADVGGSSETKTVSLRNGTSYVLNMSIGWKAPDADDFSHVIYKSGKYQIQGSLLKGGKVDLSIPMKDASIVDEGGGTTPTPTPEATPTPTPSGEKPQLGDKDFGIVSANGQSKMLSDMFSEYVFLKFSTSWCGPCVNMSTAIGQGQYPQLNVFDHDKTSGKCASVTVILETPGNPSSLQAWLPQVPASVQAHSYGAAPGVSGDLHGIFGISGYPTMLIMSKTGQIVGKGLPQAIPAEVTAACQ